MIGPAYRLVLIEWVDSTSSPPGWQAASEHLTDKSATLHSVGWLIVDGEKCKRLASSHHEADDDLGVTESVAGLITIPTEAVRRVIDLRPAPKAKP